MHAESSNDTPDAMEIVEVPFHGDRIAAIKVGDSKGLVVVKRICENIGVNFSSQLQKLKAAHWAGVAIIATPDSRGSEQEHTVIPADRLPMWMVTINPGKLRPELREKIKRYQVEAADVLARHFMSPGQAGAIGELHELVRAILAQHNDRIEQLQLEVARLNARRELEAIRPAAEVPNGWDRVIAWARGLGIVVPKCDQAAQGRICADISRRMGINPIFAQPSRERHPGNYYPLPVLHRWLKTYLTANPAWREMMLFAID